MGEDLAGADSDDSYGKLQSELRTKKMKKRHNGQITSPTTSEEDRLSDELEEEHRRDHGEVMKERENSRLRRGQGTKRTAPLPDSRELDSATTAKSRPGPLDPETKEAALAIRDEYEEKLFELAKERNVSIHSLYRTVGEGIAKSPVGTHSKSTKQPTNPSHHRVSSASCLPGSNEFFFAVSSQDYVKQLAAEYGERVAGVEDSTDIVQLQQAFSTEIAWFNKQTADAVEQVKDKSVKRTARKAVNEFIDLVSLQSGFVINTHLNVGEAMVQSVRFRFLGMACEHRARLEWWDC